MKLENNLGMYFTSCILKDLGFLDIFLDLFFFHTIHYSRSLSLYYDYLDSSYVYQ